MAEIIIAGLGPGNPNHITREVWTHLNAQEEVYVRTRRHPALEALPEAVRLISFDEVYDQAEDFEAVYETIVRTILEQAQARGSVTYAVPGHPFVAESSVSGIVRQARELEIPVQVLEGLSFIDPVCSALEIDPFDNLSLVDGLDLARRHSPGFPPDTPALIAQIFSREVASEVKLTLNAVYPDQHPVVLVHAAGTDQQKLEHLALYEIDRAAETGLLSTLYVPPLGEGTSMEAFQGIVAHLRAPEGCPWDREQTLASMRNNLLEETYEVLQAIDEEDTAGLCEELGDLLLIITMLAQIASEEGGFSLAEALQGIYQKIIRRHPHVFGDRTVDGVSGVLRNWEEIKAAERKEKAFGEVKPGILGGINIDMPALTIAQKYQNRAAHVGFDWKQIEGVWEKIHEELGEVAEAEEGEQEHELGDLLFSVVNLIRWHKLDAESALRAANQRFRRRFEYIERSAQEQGKQIGEMTLAELDALWDKYKNINID